MEFDWLGYELMPEDLPWGEPLPGPLSDPNRPPTPSRLQLAYAAEGMRPPTAKRPRQMRSHNALLACELAKDRGFIQHFIPQVYAAYWERGEEVNNLEVIRRVLVEIGELPTDWPDVLYNEDAERRIVPFDEKAYEAGVFNVPTFFIGGERYAEQPYPVLQDAIKAVVS